MTYEQVLSTIYTDKTRQIVMDRISRNKWQISCVAVIILGSALPPAFLL